MAVMKESTKEIIKFIQEATDYITAADVAAATGYNKRQVDGVFTSLTRKGLGSRVEKEIELEDGTHKKVKFLVLNEAGKALDLDAQEEA